MISNPNVGPQSFAGNYSGFSVVFEVSPTFNPCCLDGDVHGSHFTTWRRKGAWLKEVCQVQAIQTSIIYDQNKRAAGAPPVWRSSLWFCLVSLCFQPNQHSGQSSGISDHGSFGLTPKDGRLSSSTPARCARALPHLMQWGLQLHGVPSVAWQLRSAENRNSLVFLEAPRKHRNEVDLDRKVSGAQNRNTGIGTWDEIGEKMWKTLSVFIENYSKNDIKFFNAFIAFWQLWRATQLV